MRQNLFINVQISMIHPVKAALYGMIPILALNGQSKRGWRFCFLKRPEAADLKKSIWANKGVILKERIQTMFRYRFLLQDLTMRDLKVKYRRSVLGMLWSILNPLLMMVVITTVFSACVKGCRQQGNYRLRYFLPYRFFDLQFYFGVHRRCFEFHCSVFFLD